MSRADLRKGEKRQLSPSDEAERRIKMWMKHQRRGHVQAVLEISTLFEPTRRKHRPDARLLNESNRRKKPEDLIFSAKRALDSNFKTLIEEMDALQVVRILKTCGTLNEEFHSRFKNVKTRRGKVLALLVELDSLMTDCDTSRKLKIFPNFLKALKDSDQDELATILQSPPRVQDLIRHTDETNCMYRFYYNAKDKIIETIEPRRFLDDVVTIHGLSIKEYNDITHKSEREDRVRELILKMDKERIPPLQILKPMCDCYSDLYSNFKSSEMSENENDTGTPVAVRFDLQVPQETVAQEDTNEHTHPLTEIKELQRRIVDTTNGNPAQLEPLQEEIFKDARLRLSRLSFSSVKLHLRTSSAASLEELKECCRNGKAIAWLMSLLKPDDIEKLKAYKATEGKLECYLDDEDSKKQLFDEVFEECFCVLNRDTLNSNLDLFLEDFDGLELSVVDILLESKTLDKTLAESLSQVKSNSAELEANHVLTNLLLQETVPQICFCMIEKEMTRKMKTSTIQLLQGKVSSGQDMYAEDVSTIVKKNLKGNVDLLEEELDARWFLPYLKYRPEEKYVKLVQDIGKSTSRKSRTKLLVRFLCEEEDVKWFVKELKECQPHLLAILSQEQTITELSVFRNAMLSIYDYIIKEVEPFELKSHLGASCMNQLQFGDLENIGDRQERAFFFMRQMFKKENLDRVQDVMNAFSSKYTNIETAIKDVSRRGSTCQHYRCARIERLQMKMSKYIFLDDFTLPILENTDHDISSTFNTKDEGTAMQPTKCQHIKLEISMQTVSPQEALIGVSCDEVTNKDQLVKPHSVPVDKDVEENDGSDCKIQDKVQLPDESVELPLSSSSLQPKIPTTAGEKHTDKSNNDIGKEQIQREMIIETEVKEDNEKTSQLPPKEKSFCKSKVETELEENKNESNSEEKALKTNKDELQIREQFRTLSSIQNNEKQLPKESSSSELDEQYENVHVQNIPCTSKEHTIGSELNGTETRTKTQKKALISEFSKVKNDPIANDDFKECKDVQLKKQHLTQKKDTATCSNKTPDQSLLKYIRNQSKQSCRVYIHKSGDESSSKKSLRQSASLRKNDTKAGINGFDKDKTESNLAAKPEHSARKYEIKLHTKPNVNRKHNECHSVRHNSSVPCNFTRPNGTLRQRHFIEYQKEMERKRQQDEEYWRWYRYCQWLHKVRMDQICWQRASDS